MVSVELVNSLLRRLWVVEENETIALVLICLTVFNQLARCDLPNYKINIHNNL